MLVQQLDNDVRASEDEHVLAKRVEVHDIPCIGMRLQNIKWFTCGMLTVLGGHVAKCHALSGGREVEDVAYERQKFGPGGEGESARS